MVTTGSRFIVSAGLSVLADEHNREAQPENNQCNVKDKELAGGQGQHLHAYQYSEGGQTITNPYVQGVNGRFGLEFHFRTDRQPEHISGRVVDGVI